MGGEQAVYFFLLAWMVLLRLGLFQYITCFTVHKGGKTGRKPYLVPTTGQGRPPLNPTAPRPLRTPPKPDSAAGAIVTAATCIFL